MERVCWERPIVLFVDLHGHSRKSNVFCYGCDVAHWCPHNNRSPAPAAPRRQAGPAAAQAARQVCSPVSARQVSRRLDR